MKTNRHPNQDSGAVKPPVLLAVLALVVIIAAWAASSLLRKNAAPVAVETPTNSAPANVVSAPPPSAPVASTAEVRPAPAPMNAAPANALAKAGATNRLSANLNLPPRTPSTPLTRQMMAGLAALDVSKGVTKEQADAWKQQLAALKDQGAAGAAAIGEFLKQNLDINFQGVDGGADLGSPSLRLALINTLAQIGGSDAVQVSLDVLGSTASPAELAAVAGYLGQQPGDPYQDQIVGAARDALNMAEQGKLEGQDMAPVFQMLQQYGDPSVVSDLQQASSQWKYYATMALAQLDGGAGVPALVQMANAPGGDNHDFALEMLAEAATKNPSAVDALVDEARIGEISAATWANIAGILGGQVAGYGNPLADPSVANVDVSSIKGFHLAYGDQNYYIGTPTAGLSADQTAVDSQVVDRLLAATSDPAATAALQGTKSALAPK